MPAVFLFPGILSNNRVQSAASLAAKLSRRELPQPESWFWEAFSMVISVGVSRGRTLVITRLQRVEAPPNVKDPAALHIFSRRAGQEYHYRIKSDGIICRGDWSISAFDRRQVHSLVVISHANACSLFYILQDPRDAPKWIQEYDGFWEDTIDEELGITPKYSESMPPPGTEDIESQPRYSLQVEEIGTLFRGDQTQMIVDTLKGLRYRVTHITWDEYHRGSFPWKTKSTRSAPN